MEAEASKAQEALKHERAQREAEWADKTEAEREKLEGEWAAKEEAREKRYKARMAEWLGMSKKQQVGCLPFSCFTSGECQTCAFPECIFAHDLFPSPLVSCFVDAMCWCSPAAVSFGHTREPHQHLYVCSITNQTNHQSPISLQEEVEAAWAAVEEGVAGEAEKKKKDWLDSHKEEVSVSAPMTSGLASTQSPVASEQQVTKVGEKGKDSSRDVASSVLSSGSGTVTAQKSVASASRPGIASKEDAAAPVLTLVKGKGSKNVAAVAAATLVKTVKSSQIHSS